MYVPGDSLAENQTPIFRKITVPAVGGGLRVYMDPTPVPFSQLAENDLIDTADLCRIFSCSARTVYRWIAEASLMRSYKVGREFLFTKAEILRWYAADAPRLGRPPLQGG
jgi:excisionase family DNA binding protein